MNLALEYLPSFVSLRGMENTKAKRPLTHFHVPGPRLDAYEAQRCVLAMIEAARAEGAPCTANWRPELRHELRRHADHTTFTLRTRRYAGKGWELRFIGEPETFTAP